ncbi:MAG: prepilin-type N-terminal cleavage/methylation domain-containing protein [Gammaproteobacteria bacterium]|nr:prepilin-type N-terminal cleavage/methylation domain-containing protein [Gammaproteobacteria bacterium]MDH3858411.1 prepilin-type N-terminal cleavage/methylation domain-containing protein [Gammaproteobacteria bacterium]
MSLVKNYHNAGFSLVELLTVILLLGILGIVALGRFTDQNLIAARGFFDDTVNAVRFAQKLALSTGCDVRVITTASSYQLRQSSTCTANDFTNPVVNPANRGNNYQNVDIPSGFSLTAGNITFDARGRREGATSDFTVSDGSTTYSFRVHASTGLVEVL